MSSVEPTPTLATPPAWWSPEEPTRKEGAMSTRTPSVTGTPGHQGSDDLATGVRTQRVGLARAPGTVIPSSVASPDAGLRRI